MSRICGLYPCSTFHHQGPIVSLYIPCGYSGSPGRCCDDLNKFVYLQIVPLSLHLYQSAMEVFHYNWSRVMLVMQLCYGHYPGLVGVGSQLVLHPANSLLLLLVVVKQGLCFLRFSQKMLYRTIQPLYFPVFFHRWSAVDVWIKLRCIDLDNVSCIYVLGRVR